MSWSRIDDTLDGHPKVDRAGDEALGYWLRCVVRCSRLHSDGFLSAATAKAMGGVQWKRKQKALTESGMWRPVRKGDAHVVTDRKDTGRRKLPDVTITMPEDGFLIPDYLHYHRAKGESSAEGVQEVRTSTSCGTRTTTMRSADAETRSPPDPTRPDQLSSLPHPPPPSDPTAPTSKGGREGGDALQQGTEGEGGVSSFAHSSEDDPFGLLKAVLDASGWHGETGEAKRDRQIRKLLDEGFTAEVWAELWPLAEREGDDPRALLATWIDRRTWHKKLAGNAPRAGSNGAGDGFPAVYGEPRSIRDITKGTGP